jgi:hypothetical protein
METRSKSPEPETGTPQVPNSLTGQFTSLTNNLQDIANATITTVSDVANTVQDELGTTIKDAYETSRSQLMNTGSQLKSTVENTIQKVEDEFTGTNSFPSSETNLLRVQGEGLPELRFSSKPVFQNRQETYDNGTIESLVLDKAFTVDSMNQYFKNGSFQ